MEKHIKQIKGLTLAGGGSRGAFQIGAWKAFREMEISFDYITGTSIGSINAALMACNNYDNAVRMWENVQIEQCLAFTENQSTKTEDLLNIKNASILIKELLSKKSLDTEPLRCLLKEYIDESCVRESTITFGLMTAELPSLFPRPYWIQDIPKGQLLDYLMASAGLPGLTPVSIDGKRFIDGGAVDNMPISMIKRLGIRQITAVELNRHTTLKSPLLDNIQLTLVHDNEDLGNMFDLTPSVLLKNRTLGYLNAKKAYGLLAGDLFFFEPVEYHQLINEYSIETIYGLEQAANAYEMDRTLLYNAEDFIDALKEKRKVMQELYEKSRVDLKIDSKVASIMKGSLKVLNLPSAMRLSFLIELYIEAKKNGSHFSIPMKHFQNMEYAADSLRILDEK